MIDKTTAPTGLSAMYRYDIVLFCSLFCSFPYNTKNIYTPPSVHGKVSLRPGSVDPFLGTVLTAAYKTTHSAAYLDTTNRRVWW